MARNRGPENDYICRRCGCPCDFERHLGGGQGMRACKGPVQPVLRSEHEAEMEADAKAAVAALKRPRWGTDRDRGVVSPPTE